MPRTPSRYTDDQLEAMTHAWLDRGVLKKDVGHHAEQGLLVLPDGTKVEPFEVNHKTLGSKLDRERKKREGRARGEYDTMPHVDAVEDLRRRIVRVTARRVEKLERTREPDAKDITECARALREVSALAPRPEQRTPRPGRTGEGKAAGEQETRRSQLGDELLAAARAGEGGQSSPVVTDERPAEAGRLNGQSSPVAG